MPSSPAVPTSPSRSYGSRAAGLLIALLLSSGCRSDPLAEIIVANATAMGGRARLDRLQSVIVAHGPRSIATLQAPDHIRVEIFDSTGALVYAEGFDGHDAWEQDRTDSVRRVVTGPPRAALFHASQWPTNLLPLYRMAERGHRIELVGRASIAGINYHQLRLTLSDGFARDYYIHPEHHRIERARDVRELHALDGNTREIETVFSDYREVDGVWFAFSVEEFDLRTGERLSGGTQCGFVPDAPLTADEFSAAARSDVGRLRLLPSDCRSR